MMKYIPIALALLAPALAAAQAPPRCPEAPLLQLIGCRDCLFDEIIFQVADVGKPRPRAGNAPIEHEAVPLPRPLPKDVVDQIMDLRKRVVSVRQPVAVSVLAARARATAQPTDSDLVGASLSFYRCGEPRRHFLVFGLAGALLAIQHEALAHPFPGWCNGAFRMPVLLGGR